MRECRPTRPVRHPARLGILAGICLTASTLILATTPYPALADTLAVTRLETPTAFASEGDKPRGVSGMACLGQASDTSRECLVVNDEERFAEVAILTSGALTATGRKVQLVPEGDKGADVVGARPSGACKEQGEFEEFDGEGIAAADGYIYLSGSHSCSTKGKFKPSSFMVARFKPATETVIVGASPPVVERSWRLSDALRASPVAGGFGKPKTVGTNIEGIAVANGHLFVGLRTPVEGSRAHILRVGVDKLFASGTAPLAPDAVTAIPIDWKDGEKETGIRDLAALRSGDLVILSGPTIEQAGIPYRLWHLRTSAPGVAPVPLGTVPTTLQMHGKPFTGKAESIGVVAETGDRVTLVVMFDNVDEGAPRRVEITLPSPPG